MNSVLLIYLPASPEQEATWAQLNAAGKITEQGVLDSWSALQTLAPRSHRLPCYVLCPTESCSTHAVAPLGNSSAARQAMKFQIEEQLCDAPENLHIALPAAAKGPSNLVATDRQQIKQWHRALEAADLRVTALLPDALALPDNTTLTDGRRRLIRTPDHACMVDEANFETWCTIAGVDGAALALPANPAIDIGNPQQWLAAIAERFYADPDCNLLTEEFSLRSQVQRELVRWRWPLIAGLVVIALLWIVLKLGNSTLESEYEAYNYEVERIYREAFPEQRRVVRPRKQMADYLASLGDAGDHSPLLSWLQKLTVTVAANSGSNVDELEFQRAPDRLRVKLTLSGYPQLEKISTALSAEGLNVTRGTVARAGTRISAQLDISEKAL